MRIGTIEMPVFMNRIAALLIAIAAWAGLAIQFAASLATTGSAGSAIWAMLLYFTVLTNILVALAFTGVVLGRIDSPRLLGGVTVSIVLVGVVYGVLLDGLLSLSGGAWLADVILHKIVPVIVAGYWLVFAPRGGLARRDPLVWALFPLAYLPYALVRGGIEGRYAYPFLNVTRIGWSGVAANAVVMAAGFLATGFAMVWLDRRLARSRHIA